MWMQYKLGRPVSTFKWTKKLEKNREIFFYFQMFSWAPWAHLTLEFLDNKFKYLAEYRLEFESLAQHNQTEICTRRE